MVRMLAAAPLVAAMVALAAPCGGEARAGMNLVKNGDFEQNGGVGQMNGTISYATNWTVGPSSDPPQNTFAFIVDKNADTTGFPSENSPALGTNIFLYGPGNGEANGFTGSKNGGDFLGVDGSYATGTVSQSITGLTVGQKYTLSFEWAAAQFVGVNGATTQSWKVDFGNETANTDTFNLPSHGFSGWIDYSHTFTATSTAQTLSFLAQGSPSGLPPFLLLDGVSLVGSSVSAVPEPSATLIGGLGLAGVGAVRRWQRRRLAA